MSKVTQKPDGTPRITGIQAYDKIEEKVVDIQMTKLKKYRIQGEFILPLNGISSRQKTIKFQHGTLLLDSCGLQ